jgi:hypothetical protein
MLVEANGKWPLKSPWKITPINRKITPINRKITPINRKITPINRKITPINRKITPINRKITPFFSLPSPSLFSQKEAFLRKLFKRRV